MPNIIFNRFKAEVLKGDMDLDNAAVNIKVALCTSAFNPTAALNTYSQITNQVANGNGYTTGGATLAGKAVTQEDGTNRGKFTANPVTWSAATITARWAVVYNDTVVNKDLICAFDFVTDRSSSAGDFTISWHADGILYLS